ncbi:T-cell activation Rho GTPase activating protein [Entamoeba marina]
MSKSQPSLTEIQRQFQPNLTCIDAFWNDEITFTTSILNNVKNIADVMNSHSEILEQKIYQSDYTHISIKLMSQYVSALRYIANDFELFNDYLKLISHKQQKALEMTSEIKNKMNIMNHSEFNSSYYELDRQLSLITPSYVLDYFKRFQSFFTLGNNFFNDNLFIATAEKQVNETTESLNEYINYSNKSLKEILISENRSLDQLPRAVELINTQLYNKGPITRGVFRESQNATIRQIEELYMKMSIIDFTEIPCDVVASVFKKFLRGLSIKLFDRKSTITCFEYWNSKTNRNKQPQDLVKDIKPMILLLPTEHLVLFKMVMKLCFKIASQSHINSMNAQNLSVCLSTNLMTLSDVTNFPSNEEGNNEYSCCIEFIMFCISAFPLFFPNDVDITTMKCSSSCINKQNTTTDSRASSQSQSSPNSSVSKPEELSGPMAIPDKNDLVQVNGVVEVDETPQTTDSMEHFVVPNQQQLDDSQKLNNTSNTNDQSIFSRQWNSSDLVHLYKKRNFGQYNQRITIPSHIDETEENIPISNNNEDDDSKELNIENNDNDDDIAIKQHLFSVTNSSLETKSFDNHINPNEKGTSPIPKQSEMRSSKGSEGNRCSRVFLKQPPPRVFTSKTQRTNNTSISKCTIISSTDNELDSTDLCVIEKNLKEESDKVGLNSTIPGVNQHDITSEIQEQTVNDIQQQTTQQHEIRQYSRSSHINLSKMGSKRSTARFTKNDLDQLGEIKELTKIEEKEN